MTLISALNDDVSMIEKQSFVRRQHSEQKNRKESEEAKLNIKLQKL